MRKNRIVTLIVAEVVVLAVILLLILLLPARKNGSAAVSPTPVSNGAQTAAVSPSPSPTPPPTPTPPPEPTVATLAVCGDVMSHSWQIDDALIAETGEYDYTPMMAAARSRVEAADYAVANLETTFAGGPEYTGYPRFRSPDALARNLKDLGFDLMLTANNHCMDANIKGLYRTLDVLDEVGLKHVGTSRTQEEADNNLVVADVGGISVVFLGYTYGTNGLPVPENADYAVNRYTSDYLTTVCTPDTEKLLSDLEKAKATHSDLICVMIHWGLEYHIKESGYQDQMADFLIENGVDIVLGGHPHVLQPMEMRTVTLADGTQRSGYVCFSLGNFISAQTDKYTDTTVILELELTRDNITGEASVTGWDYTPMFMLKRYKTAEAFTLLDSRDALEHFDLTDKERTAVEQSIQDCVKILGDPVPSVAALTQAEEG